MKKVLIYYSTYELNYHSKKSIPRLVAAVIAGLEKHFEVTFFTFDKDYHDDKIKTKPIFLSPGTKTRALKKLRNTLPFTERLRHNDIKIKLIDRYLEKKGTKYDAILAISSSPLQKLKQLYPGANILYWFHNMPHNASVEALSSWNYADNIITPSITTYHRVMAAVEPLFLYSPWHYIANWADKAFINPNQKLVAEIKQRHNITANTVSIIYSGGNIPFKGSEIVQKVIEKLPSYAGKSLVFIYAGDGSTVEEYQVNNVRCIKTGFLSPEYLAAYFAASNIGLMASIGYEHSPLTILEMAQTNLLVITSNVGGVKEIVGDDYPFLVDKPHFVEEWVEKINAAILLPANAFTQQVISLKQNINTNFNEQASIDKFINIIG